MLGRLPLLLLALLALAGCDETPPPEPDAGECMLTPFEEGAAEGASDPLAAPDGQARAGRLEDAAAFAQASGLGAVAAGDFVLSNGRVVGGACVDAASSRTPGAEPAIGGRGVGRAGR